MSENCITKESLLNSVRFWSILSLLWINGMIFGGNIVLITIRSDTSALLPLILVFVSLIFTGVAIFQMFKLLKGKENNVTKDEYELEPPEIV